VKVRPDYRLSAQARPSGPFDIPSGVLRINIAFGSSALLDSHKQLDRLLEPHGQCHAPGDRKLTLICPRIRSVGGYVATEQREQITFFYKRHRAVRNVGHGLVRVAGLNRMLDGIRPQLLRRVPPVGAPMQLGKFVAKSFSQPLREKLRQKMW